MIVETRSVGRNPKTKNDVISYRILYKLQGFKRDEIEHDLDALSSCDLVEEMNATSPTFFDGRWIAFCLVDVAKETYGFHGVEGWNDLAKEYA